MALTKVGPQGMSASITSTTRGAASTAVKVAVNCVSDGREVGMR